MRLSRRCWMKKPLSSTAEAQEPLLNDYLLPNQTEPLLCRWTCWGVKPKFGGELSCLAAVPGWGLLYYWGKVAHSKSCIQILKEKCIIMSLLPSELKSYFQSFNRYWVEKTILKRRCCAERLDLYVLYVMCHYTCRQSSESSNRTQEQLHWVKLWLHRTSLYVMFGGLMLRLIGLSSRWIYSQPEHAESCVLSFTAAQVSTLHVCVCGFYFCMTSAPAGGDVLWKNMH